MGRGATFVGLAALQFQVAGLLGEISMPWPDEFRQVWRVMQVINLDPRQLFDMAGLPPITFHTMYILVANIVPLVIAVLGLLLFQPLYFVIWYGCLAGSLVGVGVGVTMRLENGDTAGTWIALGSGFLLLTCAVIGIAGYFIKHVNDDDKADDERVEQDRRREKSLRFSRLRTLKFLLLTGATFLGGCMLTGLFVPLPGAKRSSGTIGFIGFFLFFLAAVFFVYLLSSLSQPGRVKIRSLEKFLNANMLLVLLLLINVSYVPTINYCIHSYMCAVYECPAGTVFNPRANRDELSFSTSPDLFCDPCEFRDSRCRAGGSYYVNASLTVPPTPAPTPAATTNASNATTTAPAPVTQAPAPTTYQTYEQTVLDLCPAFRSTRVWRFPEVSCSDPSLRYFYVSSGLVLVCYLLLVPILYVRLIYRITRVVDRDCVLIPDDENENLDYLPPTVLYARKVYVVEPAASSLYQPFTLQHKYYSIALLAFRLVIVSVSTIIAAFSPEAALYLLIATHLAALAAVLYQQPFIDTTEYRFALALEVCSVINTGIATAIFHGADLPGWIIYLLLVVNVFIPLLAALITFKFVRDRNRKKAREAHERAHQQEEELRQSRIERALNDDAEELEVLLLPTNRRPGTAAPAGKMAVNGDAAAGGRARNASLVEVPKGRKWTEREQHAAHIKNDELTQAINYKTADIVTKYFASLGILLLLALGASVVGYTKGQRSLFVDGSSASQRGTMPVLAGYPNFPAFTDACCCIQSMNPAAIYNTTERWICRGAGYVVDRGRQLAVNDGVDNGLLLRPLCGGPADVELGCTIVVNTSATGATDVNIMCPQSPAALNGLGVTAVALARLF